MEIGVLEERGVNMGCLGRCPRVTRVGNVLPAQRGAWISLMLGAEPC